MFTMKQKISASEFVHVLVHQSPDSMRENTLFYNMNNEKVVRTKQGALRKLQARDFVAEDAQGSVLVNGFRV